MTITDPELRAHSSFIAACPLCSFIQRQDGLPDIITYPDLDQSRRNGWFGLHHCCELSRDCGWHDSAAGVASWWRTKRALPHPVLAMDNRRRSTLERLEKAGLEPIVAQSEVAP